MPVSSWTECMSVKEVSQDEPICPKNHASFDFTWVSMISFHIHCSFDNPSDLLRLRTVA
jgi:hypothetical protein